MELVDDWGNKKHVVLPKARGRAAAASTPVSAEAIREGLAGFVPEIVNVHCYEDVGYPWVQVVFEQVIDPEVALRVGKALIAVAGAECVYLNSLRPRAVYFLLRPAFDPQPDLPASRYGEPLEAIEDAWKRARAKAQKP